MKPVILAVDDESTILDMYEAILGDRCRIKVASSGHEALQCLHSGLRPDLILLDIMMPGMNGYEVCRHIRESLLYSHLNCHLSVRKITGRREIAGI